MLSIKRFRTLIYDYYAQNKRKFAWRDVENPYYILVSEIMLQQTQTYRVAEKFDAFVTVLPTIHDLAAAPWPLVLGLWKGLGYNRRALYLQQTAHRLVTEHGGVIPREPAILQTMPGIGPATARSIVVFAYNQKEVFIETNIRAVFLHHFFAGQTEITDTQLMPLVAKTLDNKNPRQWYYALMDYGVMLKKRYKNPGRASKHHNVQSKFEGSDRQIRGRILDALLRYGKLSCDDLCALVVCDYDRCVAIVRQLVIEKLVRDEGVYFSL
jgi:A/G-specific adenine glycosylase